MSATNPPRSKMASTFFVIAIVGALNAVFAPGTLRVFGEEELTGAEFLSAKIHDYISLFIPFLMMAALGRAIQYLADIKGLLREQAEGGNA